MRKIIFGVFFSLLTLSSVLAQNGCPAIVQQALLAVDSFCQNAGRNQACYGNVSLTATPREGASAFTFEQTGDLVDVNDIASMDLKPMDEVAGTWGVAMMKLQANLPENIPGQNVTFLLFGDVSIQPNDSVSTESPLQAFYFTSGIGDAPCAEAPSSGIMVQTPEGTQQVSFNVNGVDVQMGSTILFRAKPGEEMTISALEGAATIEVDDELFPIIAGTWARMPIDENLNLLDKPDLPVAYKNEVLDALPVNLFPRDIEIREPLNEEELAILHGYLLEGKPPCGDEVGLFPSCDHLPIFDANDPNAPIWAKGDEWGEALPPIIPIILLDNGSECVVRQANDTPSDVARPFCDEVLTPEELETKIQELGAMGNSGNIFPFNDRECVMEPGPNDPPLPADETRPFCDRPNAPFENNGGNQLPNNGGNQLPIDTRPCVMEPGPNDPPLPANETRPFCDQPNAPFGNNGEQPLPPDGEQPLPDDQQLPPPDGEGE